MLKTGSIPWNKGKTGCYSEETLQLMGINGGQSRLGQKRKPYHYKNGHSWNKGKTGLPTWNKGIPRTKAEIENIKAGISEESKRKSSERMRRRWKEGKYSIMFGKTNPSCRPEVREKIGNAGRGRVLSDEHKEKLRKSRLGKSNGPCPEHLKKLNSERMKKSNPMKEEKNVEKQRKTSKERGRYIEASNNLKEMWRRGKLHPHVYTEEERIKARNRMKEDNPMFREEVIARHPILHSGCFYISIGEQRVATALDELKIKYEHSYRVRQPGKRSYFLDFYLPKYNLVIEFDGHWTHINSEKDKVRDEYIFEKLGAKTIRILPFTTNNKERLKFKILRSIKNANSV